MTRYHSDTVGWSVGQEKCGPDVVEPQGQGAAVFRPAPRPPKKDVPLLAMFALAGFAVAGCATSSGVPAAGIPEASVAAAYIPLHHGTVLSHEDGAAVAIAPGIAVTNGHNRNLVDPRAVIGEVQDYDLLFFHDDHRPVAEMAEPQIGEAVSAFGQGTGGDLRRAQGVVKAIQTCTGCTAPAYFTFAGNAGPGFSGGPVLDASGRLIGITFGYKDEGHSRVIYAYPMDRVRAELSVIQEQAK
ncbi:MAG TPA: trypsin-like peptidase domain-containing protein [Rhizomicrobium sp.]|nr:trypsin-like peptidase domain-containing protein [Rhizomicrobium sp.]